MNVRCRVFFYGLLLGLAGNSVFAQPPADLELRLVTDGFIRPVAIRHAGDGSGRLFIVEQAGVIRIIAKTSQVLNLPFLDIRSLVEDAQGEEGLLGLAFDPDYATNGYFYVNYTRRSQAGADVTRISRFSVSADDANLADLGSETVIIEIPQDFSNHNGGDIHFSPVDGYLYIGMGDGGGGNDPNNRAQPLDTMLGKMLRIDVAEALRSVRGTATSCGAAVNYGIPADNPFLNDDTACAEIWARGLRNPWRWSFDRLTGDLFIGDVGQGPNPVNIEEIDFQSAGSSGGENYGWPCMEGTGNRPDNDPCLSSPLTGPIVEYTRDSDPGGNCAVTGGFRYRGKIPAMQGLYFYADYCSGQIWYVENNGSWGTPQRWIDTSFNISSFGEDEQGELYLADLNGGIYRFHLPILQDGFE